MSHVVKTLDKIRWRSFDYLLQVCIKISTTSEKQIHLNGYRCISRFYPQLAARRIVIGQQLLFENLSQIFPDIREVGAKGFSCKPYKVASILIGV